MTQQEQIINEIKTKGFLNSFYATYGLGIKQAPTRVHELKQAGYDIQARSSKNDSVDWYFGTAPKQETKQEWVFVGNTAYVKQEPRQGVLI